MAGFSATEAAVEGFRLTRDKPGAVALWGLFYVGVIGLVILVAALIFGASLSDTLTREPGATPEEVTAFFAATGPLLLLIFPVILFAAVVLIGAMYRAVLHPGESRFAYLRVGGDEFRLLGVTLLIALIWIGFVVAAIMVIGVIGAAADGFLRGLLIFLAVVAVICLGVWIGVRLSLAAPMTFAERRIALRGAWRLTEGRFWPLLGAYFLALVFSLMVGMLGGIISFALLAAFGGGMAALSQANNPDFSTFTPALAIGFVLYLVVQLLTAILQMVIQSTPAVSAYRQLSPRTEAEVFA